jgi:hypothetical protein
MWRWGFLEERSRFFNSGAIAAFETGFSTRPAAHVSPASTDLAFFTDHPPVRGHAALDHKRVTIIVLTFCFCADVVPNRNQSFHCSPPCPDGAPPKPLPVLPLVSKAEGRGRRSEG